MNKCIVCECSNEAHVTEKFCEAHAKLFDNVSEIGLLKEKLRKRNLMIKDLRKQLNDLKFSSGKINMGVWGDIKKEVGTDLHK